MNFSHVSYRALKKKSILLLKNARHLVFLMIFSCMILQPQRFFVEPPTRDITQGVYASYDQLIEQSKQQNWSLVFDGLVIDDDGQTTITYKIVAGDTLSSIAQDFGTTVQALVEKNWLQANQTLRKGQELIISFTENFVYAVEEQSTLQAFADKYQLNIDDLMSLNYLTPPSVEIQVGQELILPLTKSEAKAKGLVGTEEFIPLDIEPEENLRADEPTEEEEPQAALPPTERSVWIDDSNQQVITPEQTEQHLKSLEEQKAQQIAENEAKELQRQQTEREREAQKLKEQELAKIKQQTPSTTPSAQNECGTNQCLHDGSCRTKPAHAVCAPADPINAWKCEAGYTDTGRSCVKQTTVQATTSKTAQKKVNSGVISQWYFNARKAGYPNDRGRAQGHCTQYVDYRRWKNMGVRTYRRGNARLWYGNAAKAWATVSKTPKYGAAAVFAAGTNSYRGYGHVGVVIDIDRDNNLILIEEQNYVGTYVVSQRRVSMNQPIGYVYPW
jgi:surface antigen